MAMVGLSVLVAGALFVTNFLMSRVEVWSIFSNGCKRSPEPVRWRSMVMI